MNYWKIISDPAKWQTFADSEFGKGFVVALILVLAFILALILIRTVIGLVFRKRRCSSIEVVREDGSTMINREVIASMVDRELAAYPALHAEKILLTRRGRNYQLTIYCSYLLSDTAGIPAFCDEFKPKLMAALEKGFGITSLKEIRLWVCNSDEDSAPAKPAKSEIQEKDAYIGL